MTILRQFWIDSKKAFSLMHFILTGKDTWSLDANSLYKHKYDNVGEYLKKKQERLDAQTTQKKRKISE